MARLAGTILTPAGWRRATLDFEERIGAIEPDPAAPAELFVLPGFVDLHVHGGHGADCMDGAEAVRHMARFHARHGTTSLLATTVTAPPDDLRRALAGIAAAMPGEPDGARILGVHLEGPFINPLALGAQPPFAIPPDLALLDAFLRIAPILVATIAPEIDPGGALLARLRTAGTRVQLGHTRCSYAQALTALDAGAAGFTHLFNAMSGLHHRDPGCAGCALAHGEAAEMIVDLRHVSAGAVLAARRAIPRLYGVTDAVAACGMPDGDYRLGQHRIVKREDAVRLADGSLAGSLLTMDAALRNLLGLGLPMAEAARRLSTYPAEHLGLQDRGRIAPGLLADLVVVDPSGNLRAVFVAGRQLR